MVLSVIDVQDLLYFYHRTASLFSDDTRLSALLDNRGMARAAAQRLQPPPPPPLQPTDMCGGLNSCSDMHDTLRKLGLRGAVAAMTRQKLQKNVGVF